MVPIPVGDDNPTLRAAFATWLVLGLTFGAWFFIQGAGVDGLQLAKSVCDYGMVPGELTHLAPLGQAVQLNAFLYCVVDGEAINVATPLLSMFLHGSWMHILSNCLFLWIFGNNVEDVMGRLRFLMFYVVCGLVAALSQILVGPSSPVPMVGASGAIAGVLGAYLIHYPRAPVKMVILPIPWIFRLPAWLVLIFWFGEQVLAGLPQLALGNSVATGVAVWAHIGGFVAGIVLVKFFENPDLVAERRLLRHRWG